MTEPEHHRNHPKPPEHELIEKMEMVWDLRREERLTFRQIGEKMGISHTNARKWFREYVRRRLAETPDQEAERILIVQQIEEEEYETWGIYKNAFDEEIKLKALRHLDTLRRSKRDTLGLDAAKKYDVRNTHQSEADLEIQGLIAEHDRRVAQQEAERRGRPDRARPNG